MNLNLRYDGFEDNFVEKKNKFSENDVQYVFRFSNGYGASVIKSPYSYGSENDLWELAVLRYDSRGRSKLCYDTDITNDVLGCLTDKMVCDTLGEIRDLPRN